MNIFDLFEGDSARDKWNKESAKRDAAAKKREEEMTARHNRGKEDMSGAIDRLEKHLNTPVKEHDMSEGWSDAIVSQRTGRPRTPYSVYIKGKKWRDFENEDHAEAVANKLRAKFKADGRDASVITIAPTDYDKDIVKKEAAVNDVNFGHTVTKGAWIVHQDGKKPIRFKTHIGAKKYAEKNGGKVYSSEFYADKIQSQVDEHGGGVNAMNKYISWRNSANKERGITKYQPVGKPAESLREFALGDEGEEDTLLKFARLWWNGDEATQNKVEEVLAKMGWTIGENESGDENDACFVVRNGDMNGDSYIAFGKEDLNEGSMSTAAHHHAGPEFPGYWKGTDSASLSRRRMVGDDIEEGIEGNMTVKSSPLSEPLRKRNFVAKNSPITGAGKHTNQLKKAMAAGRNAKHKAQTIPFDESMNFMEWAVNNDYNFAKNPAVYKEAKEAFKKKINEISKDKIEKYYTDVIKKQADNIGIQPNMYSKLEPKHQRGIDRANNRLYKNNEERGPIAPHETYYGAMDEAKGLGTQVKIIKGSDAGKIGWIREIKLGSFKGAPKTYYIDLEDGGQANNLPGTALRIIKNKVDESLQPGEYYVWTVYFDNGGKQNIKVTSDNFDPTAYYANQNKAVVNVDYNWEKHNEI